MVEVQPEIHYELGASMKKISKRLPNIVRENINYWLPEKYKIPEKEASNAYTSGQRGIIANIIKLLQELIDRFVTPIQKLLEYFLDQVEPKIMVKLRDTTEARIARRSLGLYQTLNERT